MKTNRSLINILTLVFLLTGMQSCKQNKAHNEKGTPGVLHWNVNILIDLSNRIDTHKVKFLPTPMERDLAVIQTMIRMFKEQIHQSGKGTFQTHDKFKIFFHPQPKINGIEDLVRKMQIDFEPMEPKEKKHLFRDMEEQILNPLRIIYEETLRNNLYEGSDIWGFFKEDLNERCIENNPSYRNILLILTDGYMYWKHDIRKEGNRYNYIERGEPHLIYFRKKERMEKEFDERDFGFICFPYDLSRLEVMVLGLDYPVKNPMDYETLKRYWSKWLTEMRVQRYLLSKTDMPVHTEKLIERFLK